MSKPDDWEDYDDEGERNYCNRCDNRGYIIICWDDLCAYSDHCMHGDGEMICPECKGMSVR